MRVKKEHIVNGAASYITDVVLPRLNGNLAVQIMISAAVNAVRNNERMIDAVFEHSFVKILLLDDGSGTYEIDGMMDALYASVRKYGYFPITVPQIPFVSPRKTSINLSADDIAAIRKRIEKNAEEKKPQARSSGQKTTP